jgi:glycosyltransferase involved in cell wall biosynthesis
MTDMYRQGDQSMPPYASLIVATLGRTEPLVRLLESLSRQTSTGFEVIVVDQNPEGFLSAAILPFLSRLTIVVIRSERGLARARNAGLRHASGSIVGFPDDDCWYDTGAVEQCLEIFSAPAAPDGITGICLDEKGEQSAGTFDSDAGPLTRQNVWRRANSTTTFCRTAVATAIGGFDESLGLGSGTRWGSGEETDLLIRALDHGFRFEYHPEFVIRHPQVNAPSAKNARLRALPYARGFARVLKKHKYPLSDCTASVVRPALGAVFYMATGRLSRACLAFWTSVGRLQELTTGRGA